MNIRDIYIALSAMSRTSSPNYTQANRGSHFNPHQRRKLKGWQRENNRRGNRWATSRNAR